MKDPQLQLPVIPTVVTDKLPLSMCPHLKAAPAFLAQNGECCWAKAGVPVQWPPYGPTPCATGVRPLCHMLLCEEAVTELQRCAASGRAYCILACFDKTQIKGYLQSGFFSLVLWGLALCRTKRLWPPAQLGSSIQKGMWRMGLASSSFPTAVTVRGEKASLLGKLHIICCGGEDRVRANLG